MCVLLVWPLGVLGVEWAGNHSREVTVNKSLPLISVDSICFQIRGLVSRSNTSGFLLDVQCLNDFLLVF